MLYSVRGKVQKDGKLYPFRSRIEAPSALGSVATVRNSLISQGVKDEDVAEIHAAPMKGKSAVSIGTKAIESSEGAPRKLTGAAAKSAGKK